MPQRAKRFWTIFLTIVLVDVATKRFAVSELTPTYVPHDVIGDFLRFQHFVPFASSGSRFEFVVPESIMLYVGPSAKRI